MSSGPVFVPPVNNSDVEEPPSVHQDDDDVKPSASPSTRISAMSEMKFKSWISDMRGTSRVERIATKLEHRMKNRIPVPQEINDYFLATCRRAAKKEGYANRMSLESFSELREKYRSRVEKKTGDRPRRPFIYFVKKEVLGIWDRDETMLEVLDRAQTRIEAVNADWFWYRDFNFFQMRIIQRFVWLRDPRFRGIAALITFYTLSALVFCNFMHDVEVCPSDPTDQNRSYYGWVSALYFASVTMSTVGYGDLSLLGEGEWREAIGALYMIIAVLVGVTIFSTVAEVVVSRVSSSGLDRVARITESRFVIKFFGDIPPNIQFRMIVWLRMLELSVLFLAYNFIGTAIARIWVSKPEDPGFEPWSWKTTFYWSIQTTTTIGYGDLHMPFKLRVFQAVYTTLGVVLVGGVIGGAASLKNDLNELKRRSAWKRLEVSKRLVQEMKGSDDDDLRIDEYEFLIGSLLVLNKANRQDVEQIMVKFRELSKGKDYIAYNDNSDRVSTLQSPHDETADVGSEES